ncbi:MAG: dephospho-CoA kinase [Niabella sp.]
MLKIGITGGIGSGKSTVAKVFGTLGIPVYDSDTEAKKLMNEDTTIRQAITEAFGVESYTDGQLNRAYISAIVFQDEEKLTILNNISHPAVIAHAEKWFAAQKAPYSLKEAALLFESGGNKVLDYIIGVYAPRNVRIERVMQRNGMKQTTVENIMAKQMDEDEKMKCCDFVIDNSGNESIIRQVMALHEKFIKM